MEPQLFQTSQWNKAKKGLQFKSRPKDRRSFFSKSFNPNQRSGSAGYFEIELLIWLSIIFLILTGFMGIHKAYKTEQVQISEDFKNEWDKLESTRRN